MPRIFSSSLSLIVLSFALPAAAQPQPLPQLPPPATDAAPSSLNPQPVPPAPPVSAPEPTVLPPLPSQAPVYAPAAPPPPPPPPSAPPPPPPYLYAPEGYRLVPIDPTARTHDGFYFRAGLGGGALALRGSGPNGAAHVQGPAFSFRLAFGGTPLPGLVIGGTTALLGTTSQSGSGIGSPVDSATMLHLGVFADWFPDPKGGWHVGGLLGVASTGITFSNGNADGGSSTAFGGQAFGGYDLWVGDQWSLGLQADFAFATKASLRDGDFGYGGYSLGGVGGGLEITLLCH